MKTVFEEADPKRCGDCGKFVARERREAVESAQKRHPGRGYTPLCQSCRDKYDPVGMP